MYGEVKVAVGTTILDVLASNQIKISIVIIWMLLYLYFLSFKGKIMQLHLTSMILYTYWFVGHNPYRQIRTNSELTGPRDRLSFHFLKHWKTFQALSKCRNQENSNELWWTVIKYSRQYTFLKEMQESKLLQLRLHKANKLYQ